MLRDAVNVIVDLSPSGVVARQSGLIGERRGAEGHAAREVSVASFLVEAGAPFVMVDYGYDPEYGNLWDNHGVPSQRQPHISEMARRGYHLAGMDRAMVMPPKNRSLTRVAASGSARARSSRAS